jgi:hypothetical protein
VIVSDFSRPLPASVSCRRAALDEEDGRGEGSYRTLLPACQAVDSVRLARPAEAKSGSGFLPTEFPTWLPLMESRSIRRTTLMLHRGRCDRRGTSGRDLHPARTGKIGGDPAGRANDRLGLTTQPDFTRRSRYG